MGCLLFALPYMALVAYHTLDFVAESYALAEKSDSTVGLSYRWFIKGIYAAGIWLVVLGIFSVLLRVIVFLFGGPSKANVDLPIGHTVSRRLGREGGDVLDLLADNLALIMFVSMFFVIFTGYPVAFIMGGMALLFAIVGWLLGVFNLIGLYDIVLRMWGGAAADPVLASIPMFIFMGSILERSGSAADMLKATEVLLRRVPGALAVAVMVMGTILSAPIGTVGAAVVTLSVIALPQMLAAGYDKRLAIGTIASAGTLGILIPPAIMLVVMAEMLVTSAGTLFLAATMPGFLLSGLFLIYIIVGLDRPAEQGAQASARSRAADPRRVLVGVVAGPVPDDGV